MLCVPSACRIRCNVLLLAGAFWMEYSRTTGFCVASITLFAAEANADDEANGEGDDDADAVRAEVSDTEKALLAVTAAATAVADGDELGGIFFPQK